MPSEYVNHFTRSLAVSSSRPPSPPPSPHFSTQTLGSTSNSRVVRKAGLHDVLVTLNKGPITPSTVQNTLRNLRNLGSPERVSGDVSLRVADADSEEEVLEEAVVGKLAVALYADALDIYLAQASQTEAEAEWWADIERSNSAIILYAIQTLPSRISRVFGEIVDTLNARRMPVNLSTLSPSSLRSLFSPQGFSIRPSILTVACYPHLRNQQNLSVSVILSPWKTSTVDPEGPQSLWNNLLRTTLDYLSFAARVVCLPLELTRQECKFNRRALEKLRDQRAEVVGQLTQLRTPLSEITGGSHSGTRVNGLVLPGKKYTNFLDTLHRVVTPTSIDYASDSPLEPLEALSTTLMILDMQHIRLLKQQCLLRPSRFTRLWPSFLVLPPLSLYIYSNSAHWIPALLQMLTDAKETLRGFIEGWLVEPLVGVIRTVRAGGGGDVLVHAEGVAADLESLERMAVSLARDTLNYTPQQLELLSQKIRLGDLTPVMQAYEEDIRTPFRSAVAGTLLRTLLIQIQKTKVDIDQALSGIDKLLKSQELTFAFVGVAPALGIVYLLSGVLKNLWSGSVGKGRWGGRRKRRVVWEGLRRIERLLIRQPPPSNSSSNTFSNTSSPVTSSEASSPPLPPLPTGLLILSLTRLRSYALYNLPTDIREPLLEDLGDLEDPALGRDAKLRVVERMWRCWGGLGCGVIRF